MFWQRTKIFAGFGDVADDSTFPYSLVAAATANPTLIKIGPGVVLSIHAINQNAAIRFLKFYDTAQIPTAGVGTPVRRFGIPGSTAGAGFVLQPSLPMKFLTGIGFTLVAGTGLDTDTTAVSAADVILTVEYI